MQNFHHRLRLRISLVYFFSPQRPAICSYHPERCNPLRLKKQTQDDASSRHQGGATRCSRCVFAHDDTKRNRTKRRIRAASDRGAGLTPNYGLMKINRYICSSVVSLWAFPRIARYLRPRTSSSSAPCRPQPPLQPPSASLSYSVSVSLPFSAVIFLHLRATCLILSKGYTSVYLSISVCPVVPPPSLQSASARATRTESRVFFLWLSLRARAHTPAPLHVPS